MFLLLLTCGLYAQTECDQSFGSNGPDSVPIASRGIYNNVAAIDVDVAANATFLVNEIDIKVSNLPDISLYTFKTFIYEKTLGNEVAKEVLELTDLASTFPGTFPLTYELPDFLLDGSPNEYWKHK